MAERQARDLEVRVRIPVQVQIFLLKFMKYKKLRNREITGSSTQMEGKICNGP